MGTNYYLHINTCPHCNKPDDIIHIGKKSFGWAFTIRGYENIYSFADQTIELLKDRGIKSIKSWETWKKIILARFPVATIIKDEYGKSIGKRRFITMVEESYKNKKNLLHAKECPSDKDFLDNDGYSITTCEFS
jgi:hypothetical protein